MRKESQEQGRWERQMSKLHTGQMAATRGVHVKSLKGTQEAPGLL